MIRIVLWSLLLAFTSWYPNAAEVPVQPNFDAARFSGQWYPIQLVMDKDGKMKEVSIVGRTAVPKSNGDIDMDVEIFENGECTTKIMPFQHTDEPGVFTAEGSTIQVVETDYHTYHILHVATKLYKILHLEGSCA
ncbi:epididymal secretory protein 4 [Pogona vitticeps]